jgi:hypothetical protein
MITELLIKFGLWVIDPIVSLLPEGDTGALPGVSAIATWIARADSFVPIAGPLTLMLGVLSAVALFITVRIGLTLWNVIKP